MPQITLVRLERDKPRNLRIFGVPFPFFRSFGGVAVMNSHSWSTDERDKMGGTLPSGERLFQRYAVACLDPLDQGIKVLEGVNSVFTKLKDISLQGTSSPKECLNVDVEKTGMGMSTRYEVDGFRCESDPAEWAIYEQNTPDLEMMVDSHRDSHNLMFPHDPVIIRPEKPQPHRAFGSAVAAAIRNQFPAYQPDAVKITNETPARSGTRVCPDCKGTGRYISLITNEACSRCHGEKFI